MSEKEAAAVVTCSGVVYPWQCDQMGHMNVMWYVGKFDEATWVLFASIGITADYICDQKRGMAAVQQNIAYKKEMRAGDVFAIRTRILEVREKVIRFEHEMVKQTNGELCATCELTAVHMDLVGRKSCQFEAEIAGRARGMIV